MVAAELNAWRLRLAKSALAGDRFVNYESSKESFLTWINRTPAFVLDCRCMLSLIFRTVSNPLALIRQLLKPKMPGSNLHITNIWRPLCAGLCGSLAHSGLMYSKSWFGFLPTFQPYEDLQQKLSSLLGSDVNPMLPWALSFLYGAVLLGFLFGRAYRSLPGDTGAAKGFWFGIMGWIFMGMVFFPIMGRGYFAVELNLGFQPAVFSLLMILTYSVILGVAYSAFACGRKSPN